MIGKPFTNCGEKPINELVLVSYDTELTTLVESSHYKKKIRN
jgi:hypothetical protein